MHTIMKEELEPEDFDAENISRNPYARESLGLTIAVINDRIRQYKKDKNQDLFFMVKELLPQSFLQKRTIDLNYEVIMNMVKQRENHRLPQWSVLFMEWVRKLPYAKEFGLVD